MKNYGLKLAIILIALAISCFMVMTAVFSCSIAYAEDEQPNSTKAIIAPVSNLKDNEYAKQSTLKLSVFGKSDIFYIPESYYITNPQRINENDTFCFVDYMGLKFGYESSGNFGEDTTFDNIENAYPDVRLTLNGDESIVSIDGTTLTANHTIKLMGYNEDGTKLYVSATLDGITVYGFINSDVVTPFNVPYHPITQQERDALLAELNKPIVDNGGNITPTSSMALRIVLIIGIALPAVIIAILLFKPTKNARRVVDRKRYQDDIDYDEPRRRDREDRYYREDRGYRDERRDYDDRRDRDYR